MKNILCLFAVACSLSLSAQDYIKKRVVTQDGIPLGFSTVILKPSNKGTIANEDAFFILPTSDLHEADSIYISHVGFQKKGLRTAELQNIPIISLLNETNELAQIEIESNTEKKWVETIFNAFQRRRELELNKKVSGRLALRSYEGKNPVEVLEGEAAVEFDKAGLPKSIDFAYLSTNMDTGNTPSFFSIHTSILIENMRLFERSDVSVWPLHPGRLSRRSIGKDFQIDLINYNVQSEISEFELISKTDEFLSARVWINETKEQILKYEIFGKNLQEIPVVSIIKGKTIENFNAHLEFDFSEEEESLSFLVWELEFTINKTQVINSSIKLFISNDLLQEPIFLDDQSYHDYAMAAMLPPRSEKLDREFTLNRSKKDQEALGGLQEMSSKLETSLIFWNAEQPFDIGLINKRQTAGNGGFSTRRGSTEPTLNQKYSLSFNGVVYLTAQNEFEMKAFFDRTASSIPADYEYSLELLVNLIFDEYAYAANRIAADARSEDIRNLRKLERQELELRENRLLINSKGGNDLTFLLQQNKANYEIQGIDRFYQLHKRSFESPLFESFNKHINPESRIDLALAHLLIGEYNKSLGIIRAMSNPTDKGLYLKALNLYFKNLCDDYKATLKDADKAGFPIPELARSLCH
ncbi:MAG: hypothetical protein MK086_10465 [Flavobacteriales bacterium]|nr:hypothetical protein [Flavobacteriales bacterium]